MSCMDNKAVFWPIVAFCLLLAFVFISSSDSIKYNRNCFYQPSNISKTENMTVYRNDLDEALAKAANENKTVILTVVDKAYVEGDKPMFDMFLDGFWLGEDTQNLTNNLLVIAMDQTSYDRCKFLHLHCYMPKTDGDIFDGEKLYMSEAFVKMMWTRTLLLGDVLKLGYNFIFTDTDILWLRNPFPRLISSLNNTVDLQISVDRFNGREFSPANQINTGFYMIKSNNKTIAMFDKWYSRKNNSVGMKEQDVLQFLIWEKFTQKLGLKIIYLDTLYFSGFCENSRDVRQVATVHANCCKTITAKMIDLTAVIHVWKRFRSSPEAPFKWPGHKACLDSWKL